MFRLVGQVQQPDCSGACVGAVRHRGPDADGDSVAAFSRKLILRKAHCEFFHQLQFLFCISAAVAV